MNGLEIEIGGKVRYLKFNQATLETLGQRTDPKNPNVTSGYALVYAAIAIGAFVKQERIYEDKETPFSFEICCDWVDQLDGTVLESIVNAFKSSQVYLDKIAPLLEGAETVESEEKTVE